MELTEFGGFRFRTVEKNDIPVLGDMMDKAILAELKRYNIEIKKNDVLKSENLLNRYLIEYNAEAYCIYADNKVVGMVIYWTKTEDKKGLLGHMFVDTEYQNMGLGKIMWDFVLSRTPYIRHWDTELPLFSKRGIYFLISKLKFVMTYVEKKSREDLICHMELKL
ncbi:MAG: GNAT family N-acetyltransferase [Clostridia bacterium]|nr:GNAT family N-acetyltransferase [Clostridia bacterium]